MPLKRFEENGYLLLKGALLCWQKQIRNWKIVIKLLIWNVAAADGIGTVLN